MQSEQEEYPQNNADFVKSEREGVPHAWKQYGTGENSLGHNLQEQILAQACFNAFYVMLRIPPKFLKFL